MKNEFAKEYFQNLKREPTPTEATLVDVLTKRLASTAYLSREIGDVKLPDGNMDVIGAYGVASRLHASIGEEKLTVEGLATVLERKAALERKKKNLEVESVPTFAVTISEEGDEAMFAVSAEGGDNPVDSAVNALISKRVVAGSAVSVISTPDPVKLGECAIAERCAENAEIAGVPHASHVEIVGVNEGVYGVSFAVGSAPHGQISKKKLKEGDLLIMMDVGAKGAHAVRRMQRILHVQKLARPMIALEPVVDGGLVCAALSTQKGFEMNVDGVPVCEPLDGVYLAVVRGNEIDEWLTAVSEVGVTANKIGALNESGAIEVVADGDKVVSVDLSLIKHLARTTKTNAVLPDESGARLGAVDGLTRVYTEKGDYVNAAKAELARLSVCNKKGLEALSDGFAGEEGSLLPFGGKNGLTPALATAVQTHASGNLSSVVCHSEFSSLARQFPFISAVNAVAVSVVKQLVTGAKLEDVRVYPVTVTNEATDPVSMGEKLAATLGTTYALNALGLSSHGRPMHVPGADGARTVAFSLGLTDRGRISTNVFTKEGRVYRIALPRGESSMPDLEHIKKLALAFEEARSAGAEWTATLLSEGDSTVTAVIKSCLGSGMGFYFHKPTEKLFEQSTGDVLISCTDIKHFAGLGVEYVGEVQTGVSFEFGTKVLNTFGVSQNWTAHFERAFPTVATNMRGLVENVRFRTAKEGKCITPVRPRVFIPIMQGTNNEYYLMRCFRDAGAIPVPVDVSGEHNEAVLDAVSEALEKCQIIAITDGRIDEAERERFVALMCNKRVKAEADKLMGEREGLSIGTGAGYDILNRLGLLAGDVVDPKKRDFELEKGNLGRRIFTTASIKVVSTLSPWLYAVDPGEVYSIRLTGTDGRLKADAEKLDELVRTGRIATQFVDGEGFATMESPYNVTGADMAIEGTFSPSGRSWGRCATNERADASYVGTECSFDMKVFESGVKYFK